MSSPATFQPEEIPAAPLEPLALELARKMIARRYGFCVNNSWAGQLAACIEMRAAATGRTGMDDYVRALQTSPEGHSEMTALAESILNGETHFLRTTPHFAALADKVVAAWRATREPGQRLRIVSVGCSTGEEPYSMALTLHERLAEEELALVEITGLDVNSRSLDFARTGCFDAFQLRELPREKWSRWFTSEGARWRIHPKLRASVRFMQHNLLEPLPFAGLDVIFCRNVMIYFSRTVMGSCMREFHAALRPRGFLFLGHAESAFAFPDYFEPVQIDGGVIYQNKISPSLPQ